MSQDERVATLPTTEELQLQSMQLLADGVASSEAMRFRIAAARGFGNDRSDLSTFVNSHAWALVRLQAEELIAKQSEGSYQLTLAGRAWLARPVPLRGPLVHQIAEGGVLEPWAAKAMAAKNRINRAKWPNQQASLSLADLVGIWDDSDGRCAVTGLAFNMDKYGPGAAKRAFAPSLDRIDPLKPYTRENCRFVLAAVNFALNSFGDEVLDRIVVARRARMPRRTARRLEGMNALDLARAATGGHSSATS